MTEYRKALCGELPQIIEFIDMVFSLSGTPHDFASLLPKLYGDNRETPLRKGKSRRSSVLCP